jgi:hypothetical protein
LLNDVLASSFSCKLCGARIDKKAMQLDHEKDKADGGAADIDNSQWTHPYCNSTYKQYLRDNGRLDHSKGQFSPE